MVGVSEATAPPAEECLFCSLAAHVGPAAPTWSGSQGQGGVLRISTPELCPGQALRPWGTKAKGIRDPAASEAPGHLPLGPCFVLKADPVPDEMGWEGPEQTVFRNRPVSPPLWQAQLRAGFSR